MIKSNKSEEENILISQELICTVQKFIQLNNLKAIEFLRSVSKNNLHNFGIRLVWTQTFNEYLNFSNPMKINFLRKIGKTFSKNKRRLFIFIKFHFIYKKIDLEIQFTSSIMQNFSAFYKPLLEEKSMRIFIIFGHRKSELADYLKNSNSIENDLLFSWLFFLANFEEEIKISENILLNYLIGKDLIDDHKNKMAKLLQKLLKKKKKPKKTYIYTFPLSENEDFYVKERDFEVLLSKSMDLVIKKVKNLQKIDELAYRLLKINLNLAKINEIAFTSNKNYLKFLRNLRKILDLDTNPSILINNDKFIHLNKKEERCFKCIIIFISN